MTALRVSSLAGFRLLPFQTMVSMPLGWLKMCTAVCKAHYVKDCPCLPAWTTIHSGKHDE